MGSRWQRPFRPGTADGPDELMVSSDDTTKKGNAYHLQVDVAFKLDR